MAEHPMNLPEELKQELWTTFHKESIVDVRKAWKNSVVKAYRAGADAELRASCEYISDHGKWFVTPKFRLAELRAARRPKPPTLAEQALDTLETKKLLCFDHPEGYNIIHRALKRLQELESNG